MPPFGESWLIICRRATRSTFLEAGSTGKREPVAAEVDEGSITAWATLGAAMAWIGMFAFWVAEGRLGALASSDERWMRGGAAGSREL